MDLTQLRTLAAVADLGSFEKAAQELGVTQSAVSQRIKALEQSCGQILLSRGPTTCLVTEAGGTLLRYARQITTLLTQLQSELAPGDGKQLDLPIAINQDSLNTWFRDVFADVASWADTRLKIYVDNEYRTSHLLRNGTVIGAITASSEALTGCRTEPLGWICYLPLVRADMVDPATGHEGIDVLSLPVVCFDESDSLHMQSLGRLGVDHSPPRVLVPSSIGLVDAIGAGLGWGMVPAPLVPDGSPLVLLPGLFPLRINLYWHHWKLSVPAVTRLAMAMKIALRAHMESTLRAQVPVMARAAACQPAAHPRPTPSPRYGNRPSSVSPG